MTRCKYCEGELVLLKSQAFRNTFKYQCLKCNKINRFVAKECPNCSKKEVKIVVETGVCPECSQEAGYFDEEYVSY